MTNDREVDSDKRAAGDVDPYGSLRDLLAGLRDNRKLARFLSALEHSRHIFYCLDLDTGRHDYVSPWFAELTGYAIAELHEKNLDGYAELLHPEDRHQILLPSVKANSPVNDNRVTRNIEYRMQKADGSWLWLSDWRTFWLDTVGQAVYCSGTIADVTVRRAEEEKSRISEETLRKVFDAAPFPITVTTPREGEVLYVNRQAWGFYGLDPEVDSLLQFRTPEFYVNPDDRMKIVEKLRAKGEALDVLIEMRRRDGRQIWVSFNARMTTFAGRQAIVSAQFDIDERKRAEENLRDSEDKFFKMFMNAPLIMGIADFESGRIIDINRQFEKISGFTREELVGKRYADYGLVEADNRGRIVEIIKTQGAIKGYEMVARTRDGKTLQLVYNGELISIDGRPTILSIIEDVTEKRRQQEQELKTQRLEALGVLAGGIAHDFNNILTGILGNLSLARTSSDLTPQTASRLEACEQACTRASHLSHQLLTFAKGGAPQKRILALIPFLEETVPFALHGSNVKPVMTIPEKMYSIEADPGQLAQVFSNLLINAAQAMPRGGEIKLNALNLDLPESNIFFLPPGRYVQIRVEDHGCGIPRELLEKIFDPYFTTKAQGTGLGLTTVYSIVRRHGGGVWVDSTDGVGSVFTILLPAVDAVSAQSPAATKLSLPSDRKLRILLMDDDQMIRDLGMQILDHLGFSASVVADGREAIILAEKAVSEGDPFDAAILDLTVPGGMGGFEAASILQQGSPNTMLVVSSGYSNDPVLANHLEHGFAGVIHKPYKLQEFAFEMQRLFTVWQ